MAKRKDRRRVIVHQEKQLKMLKELTPNETPEEWRDTSDTLIDIARIALDAAYELEAGNLPPAKLLNRLYFHVQLLADDLVYGEDEDSI